MHDDASMDEYAMAWNVVEFKTTKVGSVVVGDASGAGSITENELEKKPNE